MKMLEGFRISHLTIITTLNLIAKICASLYADISASGMGLNMDKYFDGIDILRHLKIHLV